MEAGHRPAAYFDTAAAHADATQGFSWVTDPIEYPNPLETVAGSPDAAFLFSDGFDTQDASYETRSWRTADGSRTTLNSDESHCCGVGIAVTRDSSHLFYETHPASTGQCTVFVSPLKGPGAPLMQCGAGPFFLTGDGDHALAYGTTLNPAPNTPSTWFLLGDQGAVTPLGDPGTAFVSAAPDNTDILEASGDPTPALQIAHLTGGAATVVTPPVGYDFATAPTINELAGLGSALDAGLLYGEWAPDGLHVFVPLTNIASGVGALGVVSLSGSTAVIGNDTSAETYDRASDASFNAAGTDIAYTAIDSSGAGTALWVASVDGSTKTQVAELDKWFTTIDPAGANFVYDTSDENDQGRIGWVAGDGSSTHTVFDASAGGTIALRGVSWVDTNYVYFFGYDSSQQTNLDGSLVGAGIYAVPLSGQQPPQSLVPYSSQINDLWITGVSADRRVSGWSLWFPDPTTNKTVELRGWTALASSSTGPPAKCLDAALIGVRGSGDNSFGTDFAGRHANEIARLLDIDGVDLYSDGQTNSNNLYGVIGLNYPAISVGNALEGTFSAAYQNSVNTGVSNLLAEIRRLRDPVTGCGPDYPILLTGFSQGSQVIQSALEQLNNGASADATWESIAGAALIASPRFSPNDPDARGTFVANYPLGGIRGQASIPTRFSSISRSWCLATDPVCTFSEANLIHYKTHTKDYDPGSTSGEPLLEDAAGLLDWDLKSRIAGDVSPSPVGTLAAYPTGFFGFVTISAAAVYSRGAPTTSYRWDFNGDGKVDQTTSRPFVQHLFSTGDPFRLSPRPPKGGQTSTTVSVTINYADGTSSVMKLCVRYAGGSC